MHTLLPAEDQVNREFNISDGLITSLKNKISGERRTLTTKISENECTPMNILVCLGGVHQALPDLCLLPQAPRHHRSYHQPG